MEDEKICDESIPQNNVTPCDEVQTEPNVPADGTSQDGSMPVEPTDILNSEDAGKTEPVSETIPHKDKPTDEPKAAPNLLDNIDSKLDGISDMECRIFSEVREMHKLYHSEFAGRLKSMQDELEQYRKIDKGRAYDDILSAIARIYGNNETLADEVTEPKAKKNICYMLLDLEDLLEVYGMSKLRSSQGEKRNPRHCQILNRIPTDDSAKHDTVVKSYNSGFYIGNRTVIKELVDIYFYEGQASKPDTESSQTDETVQVSDSE